MKKKDTI